MLLKGHIPALETTNQSLEDHSKLSGRYVRAKLYSMVALKEQDWTPLYIGLKSFTKADPYPNISVLPLEKFDRRGQII